MTVEVSAGNILAKWDRGAMTTISPKWLTEPADIQGTVAMNKMIRDGAVDQIMTHAIQISMAEWSEMVRGQCVCGIGMWTRNLGFYLTPTYSKWSSNCGYVYKITAI